MSAKDKFDSIVNEFKSQVEDAARDALNSIHSEMVPYLNDDTENNAIYRAHDIVSSMLSGNFTLDDDQIICDGWKTKLTSNDHDRLVNKLAEKCADVAMIKKVERLEQQLKEAYKSKY